MYVGFADYFNRKRIITFLSLPLLSKSAT